MRFHFDGVIAVHGSSSGVVGDSVLAANIAGNFSGDRIDIFQRAREEGDSSCLSRERMQVMSGMSRFAATAKHESNGVDNGTLHVLNAMDRIIQGELRRIVIPIGN